MKRWRNLQPELEVDFRKLTGWRGFFTEVSGRLATDLGLLRRHLRSAPKRYAQNLDLDEAPDVDAASTRKGHFDDRVETNDGAWRDGREFGCRISK